MTKTIFSLFLSVFVTLAVSCQSGSGQSGEIEKAPESPVSDVDFEVDMGQKPWAFDIEAATLVNDSYRSVNWTGEHMQLVFMSLKPGEFIDLEIHRGHDQFIRIEQGQAVVWMGLTEDDLSFRQEVADDWAIMIPAGYWHVIENTGDVNLKLYTLYGPPEHAKGTINKTYEDARDAHDHHH